MNVDIHQDRIQVNIDHRNRVPANHQLGLIALNNGLGQLEVANVTVVNRQRDVLPRSPGQFGQGHEAGYLEVIVLACDR